MDVKKVLFISQEIAPYVPERRLSTVGRLLPQGIKEQGIEAELINIHTIKPLDVEAVLKSVAKTRCVVTAEEHMRNGGLGDSIAQVLALNGPAPIEMVAVDDMFGQSGTPDELLKAYHLDTPDIVEAVQRVIKRK